MTEQKFKNIVEYMDRQAVYPGLGITLPNKRELLGLSGLIIDFYVKSGWLTEDETVKAREHLTELQNNTQAPPSSS